MNFENFKAGHWIQRDQYKSFEPVKINVEWIWKEPTINVLLEKATQSLGELNAYSLIVPDVDVFIQMHVVKEAQSSSRIEGTQTEINEVLLPAEQIAPEKKDDWQEVSNYIEALNTSIKDLETLPLSNRLLKQSHAILMQGVRGQHKMPGELRASQNWIGGSKLKDASFIPPHHQGILALMSDLEKFWHNENIAVPHLIRIAISHYQFETIHPFLEGNGRIGRLLIPLYLIHHGVLKRPSLYMSDFFDSNRDSYYAALMQVRTNNSLISWVRFFLNGLTETAKKGCEVFHNILDLQKEVAQSILTLGKRATQANKVINQLYHWPVINAKQIETLLEVSTPTANSLIKLLINRGILSEMTGQKRWRTYCFQRYLDLF